MSDLNALVDSLVRRGYLRKQVLIEAFRAIDRRDFMLPEYKEDAYEDIALPIGYGQTISQPLTVAFMLELLAPSPGERILDVGTGSGWKAGLLAYCVGNSGKVVSIERIPELKEMAERNIGKYGFIEQGIVTVLLGDGSRGAPLALSPSASLGINSVEGYDKIIAGAAATGDIPQAWRVQVKPGGRIVAPVEHSIVVYDKKPDGAFETHEHFGFSFVPLIQGKR